MVVTTAGTVRRYGGWPLAEQLSFDVGYSSSAALGDVDANGSIDLVVSVASQLRTYSVETGHLIRALPVTNGYSSMALAQMDADPALEILLGGNPPGIIVDGATQAIDWSQPTRLGAELAVGSIGTSGTNIAAANTGNSTFGLFNGLPWSAYLSGSISNGVISGFDMAILETAEGESLLVAAGAPATTKIFDAANLQLRRTIPSCNSPGSVDISNNGTRKLLCLPGLTVALASSQTGAFEWRFDATKEPLTRSAIGDVDGDGQLELVAASATSWAYGYRSLIISDLLTGVEKWRAPIGPLFTFDPLSLGAVRILLAPRAAGLGMNIILAGNHSSNGQIMVVDGVSKATTLSVGGSQPGSPFYGREIGDAELFDYDHDGVQDFVVGSRGSGSQGAYLQVMSGATGAQLWTSVPMGAGSPRVNNVLVIGRNRGDPELVAVLPQSLRSYDAKTGLLRWTWSIDNNGAILLPNAAGDELLVYRTDGTVVVHAADTRQFHRSFSLPAPLSGLVALPGDTRGLLAMQGERLTLVDSRNGVVLAVTDPLGAAAQPAGPPAVYKISDSLWHVAIGTNSALYRKLVVLDDVIFYGSFDGAP